MISEQISSEYLLQQARSLADSYRYNDATGADLFPRTELSHLFEAGFSRAPLPIRFGGAGIGTSLEMNATLLETLREIGRANLSLGRTYEGHVNAIILIFTYGSLSQQKEAAQACLAEKLFAVWNTDGSQPTHLRPGAGGTWILHGQKAFASAVRHVDYYVMTAEKSSGGRQMCLIDAATTPVVIDDRWWNPLGMIGSGSFLASFNEVVLSESVFIGEVGDIYKPPLFLGGAIRTSAIHLGGAEALFKYLQDYSRFLGRTENSLLRRRAALIYAAIESGRGWIKRAATTADATMHLDATPQEIAEMNFTANITRVAIEKICSEVIQLVIESVGARGLNQPFRFADVIRDLTMFLRQPDPDRCVTEAGRYVLEDLNG